MNGEFFGISEIKKSGITPDELGKINSMTLRKFDEKELFTFKVKLCDNEIDRDFQRFSIPALGRLSEMFKGVTGIENHDPKSGNQRSRIYDAKVVTTNSLTTSGEPYTYISASCYCPKTKENGEFIASLESGIRKEVSVGCSVRTVRCSVCGKNRLTEVCEHIPGMEYDGEICHEVLENPADAYEWSFVAVPAQKKAGVIKSRVLREALSGDIEKQTAMRLERDAENGRVLKNEADRRLVAKAALLLTELDTEMFGSIVKRMTFDEVSSLDKSICKELDGGIQLMPRDGKIDNSEYKF